MGGGSRGGGVHIAHMTGRNWGLCYNWQYSCLYKPYYTTTTLDSLIFHPTPTPTPSIRDASAPSHSKDTCKKRQE